MNDSKIKDIVFKLKKLDCPSSESSDEWIKEILFKSNTQRYNLMEWILTKLEFNVGKNNECRKNSEERMKDLLTTFSELGLCQNDDSAVIEGVAPLKSQVDFWKSLVDLVWLRSSFHCPDSFQESFLSQDSVDVGTAEQRLSSEYEGACAYVSSLCKSVNFEHLFSTTVELFPPHIAKEAAELSQVCPGPNCLKGTNQNSPSNDVAGEFDLSDKESDIFSLFAERTVDLHESLDALESEVSASLSAVQQLSAGFGSSYSALKLNLDVSPDPSPDLTAPLTSAHRKSDVILEMKRSLSDLKMMETSLEKAIAEISNRNLSGDSPLVSDALLKEFTSVILEKRKIQDELD